jgi:hypothetical protein
VDVEQVGRAFLEYGGIPLALFMAIGILVNFLHVSAIQLTWSRH